MEKFQDTGHTFIKNTSLQVFVNYLRMPFLWNTSGGCLFIVIMSAIATICVSAANQVDTGRKLNVHKMVRRRPGRLLHVLCTFNLRPVSTGKAPLIISL